MNNLPVSAPTLLPRRDIIGGAIISLSVVLAIMNTALFMSFSKSCDGEGCFANIVFIIYGYPLCFIVLILGGIVVKNKIIKWLIFGFISLAVLIIALKIL
jgi:hypothetical protein